MNLLPDLLSLSSDCPPRSKTRITVLGGFLGAGKTTLLKHLLQNSSGLRIGVVVNDLANVNIDASLVERSSLSSSGASQFHALQAVQLKNGCACCTASGELFNSLARLVAMADNNPYHHIIIELSGVGEPKQVWSAFEEQSAYAENADLIQLIELRRIVAVVDSAVFVSLYRSTDLAKDRIELFGKNALGFKGNSAGKWRKIVDLIVEQLECADVILLNKVDKLQAGGVEELEFVSSWVRAVNHEAVLLSSTFARVDLDILLPPANNDTNDGSCDTDAVNSVSVSPNKHILAASKSLDEQQRAAVLRAEKEQWLVMQNRGAPHVAKRKRRKTKHTSFCSFVYRRRRPFDPQRLHDLLLQRGGKPIEDAFSASSDANPTLNNSDPLLGSVIRSKGFVWLTSAPRSVVYWSHAGGYFELSKIGLWWCEVPHADWPEDKIPADVAKDFQGGGEWGDKRQELVFIGMDMDIETLSAKLDSCLLTEEEMVTFSKTQRRWSKGAEKKTANPQPEHSIAN